MYIATNNDVRVTVTPSYKGDMSSKHDFFWEYTISVENTGSVVVQVVGKYYQLICSDGQIHETTTGNIIGEQPVLRPGEAFKYKSLANLKTSSGIIKGCYKILSKGKEFDIEIPTFSLDNPYDLVSIN